MDSVFFWLSKLSWLVISPFNLIFLLLIVAWGLLIKNKIRAAKWLLSGIMIVLVIVAVFPIGDWLLYPLEKRFLTNPNLPETVDGIIVLSGSEKPILSSLWGQPELGDSAERNFAFLSLAKQYKDTKLVFTGGSSSLLHQEYKGADVARSLFEMQHFDISRVTFERDSRNTFENAVNSADIVELKPGERWILITSASHMPRAVGVFCHTGWSVIPYPVDHRTLPDLTRIGFSPVSHLYQVIIATKEWLGLLVYYLTGKTSELFPDGCHK